MNCNCNLIKTGIMGGTFDPIHKGHIAMAYFAMEQYKLDEVWFMPAGNPYFKSAQKVTDAATRLKMTELSIADCYPKFKVSDFEAVSSEPTYTSQTILRLKKIYPEREFYFIIGRDSLYSIERWYKVEDLFREAVILCAERNDDKNKSTEEKFKESISKIKNIRTCQNYKQVEAAEATEVPKAVETEEAAKATEAEVAKTAKTAEAEQKTQNKILELNAKYNADIRLIDATPIDISSTEIRKHILSNEDISVYVMPSVAEYIKEKGLYK